MKNMKNLPELLQICTKSGYFKAELKDKLIHNVNFLPLGSTLIENIRQEWNKNKGTINTYSMKSNPNGKVYLKDHTLFDYYKTNKFRENFQHVKNNFHKYSPLAIKEELKFENKLSVNANELLNVQFSHGTVLSCCYFFNESMAIEQFYKIQRERKIWWMKFSLNPGRYILSDLKNDLINEQKVQTIKIKSKFNFGNLDLEHVEMIPIKALQLDNHSDFNLIDGRLNKNIIPAIIRTEICLETAALGILFDAIEETKHGKISIQRKIAPYQCSLFCLAEDEKYLLELEDLAKHLANVIRKSGITVLNLQKCFTNNKQTLQNEIIQMDKIGIPYSIILEKSSLQNGLMKLRNRDTTISEMIHN